MSQEEPRKEYRRNLIQEDLMNTAIECSGICQTSNKEFFTMEDKACLQNCGYNRQYLTKVFKELGLQGGRK